MQQKDPQLIHRERLLTQVEQCHAESPVTVLLGARQTGKTTIARLVTDTQPGVHYFDLERTADRAALATPEQTLESLTGLVVIDEVQSYSASFGHWWIGIRFRPSSCRSGAPHPISYKACPNPWQVVYYWGTQRGAEIDLL